VSRDSTGDVPLPGGRMTRGIVRRGDVVRRPAGRLPELARTL